MTTVLRTLPCEVGSCMIVEGFLHELLLVCRLFYVCMGRSDTEHMRPIVS